MRQRIVGIIGGHLRNTTDPAVALAEQFGSELARRGYALICGGYDGIMEAACKGCKREGGTTLAVLKGKDAGAANTFVDFPILTSMDVASNNILVWTASCIIAFDGRFGTLNEIALALDFGKPIVLVGTHRLINVVDIDSKLFAYYEGYDCRQVGKIIDRLESMKANGNE